MFKKTHIARAILMAVSCQFAYAEQQDTKQENDEIEVIQVSGIRGSLNKGLSKNAGVVFTCSL